MSIKSPRHGVITARAVIHHLEGIAAPLFDIGVFDPCALDGEGQMLLRTWTHKEIVDSLDWLRHRNAKGHAIYIRPSGEHAYTLIDDLTADSIAKLSEEYTPSVVVETSPGNFQAWLYHGRVLPAELGSQVAKLLAFRAGGDPGAAAWNQFGRMSGMTNNKLKYRQPNGLQPFVRLHSYRRQIYKAANDVIAEAQCNVDAVKTRVSYPAGSKPFDLSALKTIADFHRDPRYAGDLHRADLAWATYAISHGLSVDQVSSLLAERDLTHKGPPTRQRQYVERTLAKALSAIQHSPG